MALKSKPVELRARNICISMFDSDIAELNAMLAELHRRGYRRATKSMIVRAAIDKFDLNEIYIGDQQ